MKIIFLLFSLLLFNIAMCQVTPAPDSLRVADSTSSHLSDTGSIIRTGHGWPKNTRL
ncbi:MAG: hypothetical protein ABI863_08360 [Ginsengibacter sp.]